jgi:hypothetical protein
VDTVLEIGIFKIVSLDLQWAFHWLQTNVVGLEETCF